jgi:hypothetical protein
VNFGPLRSLVLELNQAAHGVNATVTRPAPDNAPIATKGIWRVAPLDERQPYGTDFHNRVPRRVFVLSRSDVPTLPRGTVVVAPEVMGGADKTWKVDGLEPTEGDYFLAVMLLVN